MTNDYRNLPTVALRTMRILKRVGNDRRTSAANHPADGSAAFVLAETIYNEMIAVMDGFADLRQEDFDLAEVKTQIVFPVAHYLAHPETSDQFVKPLFVSGAPGIGKTTLLMLLDEALYRLNLPVSMSCRGMVASGNVVGYFSQKPVLHVTPLSLFSTPTAVLSARDWNNVLRHWTFDEDTASESDSALLDLMERLQGKVVIVDEAELEGYVYFSELLAQHGILVILSSNLAQDQLHLAPDHVRVIALRGLDHRQGDIARVCLPNAPHPIFDLFAVNHYDIETFYGVPITRAEIDGRVLAYLDWSRLENQPLMKGDFAACFTESGAAAILLDSVPFFAEISAESVGLNFLGHLSRFVNFVDAIHDCRLPLLIRGTNPHPLDSRTVGTQLQQVLADYDQRTGGQYGQVAWIEWTRGLSRLRSREALNRSIRLST
ncbi:MAG TPA: hypothetical protein VKQ72_15455 [Aggregatilineales bacterium]|nr:hypothetical protein [Aggregatilineales bacterium]